MHKDTWKNFEKDVTEKFHVGRTSILQRGLRSWDGGGCFNFVKRIRVAIECKVRAQLPKVINEALDQLDKAGIPDDAIPVAMIKQKGRHLANGIVVIRVKHFLKMLELPEKERNIVETDETDPPQNQG